MIIFQGTCNNTIVILILENHVGGLLKYLWNIYVFNLKLWAKSSYAISLKISVNTKIRISYFIHQYNLHLSV